MVIGQQPMMQSQEIRIEPSTILSIKISQFGLDLMLSNNLDNSIIQIEDQLIGPISLSE